MDIIARQYNLPMLTEWYTAVNYCVYRARVRSAGWDVSSSPVKVVLEKNKLDNIYVDAPRELYVHGPP